MKSIFANIGEKLFSTKTKTNVPPKPDEPLELDQLDADTKRKLAGTLNRNLGIHRDRLETLQNEGKAKEEELVKEREKWYNYGISQLAVLSSQILTLHNGRMYKRMEIERDQCRLYAMALDNVNDQLDKKESSKPSSATTTTFMAPHPPSRTEGSANTNADTRNTNTDARNTNAGARNTKAAALSEDAKAFSVGSSGSDEELLEEDSEGADAQKAANAKSQSTPLVPSTSSNKPDSTSKFSGKDGLRITVVGAVIKVYFAKEILKGLRRRMEHIRGMSKDLEVLSKRYVEMQKKLVPVESLKIRRLRLRSLISGALREDWSGSRTGITPMTPAKDGTPGKHADTTPAATLGTRVLAADEKKNLSATTSPMTAGSSSEDKGRGGGERIGIISHESTGYFWYPPASRLTGYVRRLLLDSRKPEGVCARGWVRLIKEGKGLCVEAETDGGGGGRGSGNVRLDAVPAFYEQLTAQLVKRYELLSLGDEGTKALRIEIERALHPEVALSLEAYAPPLVIACLNHFSPNALEIANRGLQSVGDSLEIDRDLVDPLAGIPGISGSNPPKAATYLDAVGRLGALESGSMQETTAPWDMIQGAFETIEIITSTARKNLLLRWRARCVSIQTCLCLHKLGEGKLGKLVLEYLGARWGGFKGEEEEEERHPNGLSSQIWTTVGAGVQGVEPNADQLFPLVVWVSAKAAEAIPRLPLYIWMMQNFLPYSIIHHGQTGISLSLLEAAVSHILGDLTQLKLKLAAQETAERKASLDHPGSLESPLVADTP
eukprot:CAMPEP_0184497374 /NCGR_PEP_ID=MMETSP0113_2-20130426/36332_1 /TAXON_ID=91329 /ORGANISM="Norrisiella sphaerica, Strain BC52" /LENGTH=775 /DNA_ID=CAMNT_0026884443 /DNA_START=200 /DNA_END=2523 /DNA_ORIENTATION=-